ncbi:hypothetical protein V6A89_003914 [Enterobacter hormaechei]
MTYLLHKLSPSFAHNQTLTLQSALRENTTLSEARYSLIVSLYVQETGVDLLTPVQLKVDALIASQIEIPS